MRLQGSGPRFRSASFLFCLGLLGLLCTGCASPGAPKPPSLQVPQAVGDLSAIRSGGTVQIRFTGPSRTTDSLGLRGVAEATVCRELTPGGPCRAVEGAEIEGFGGAASRAVRPDEAVIWTDTLPPQLATGPLRPMAYRVELRNGAGRSAGASDAVYVPAGTAPPVIGELQAEGTRLGVLLRWTAVAGGGEVLLERRQVDPPPEAAARSKPGRAGGHAAEAVEPGLVLLQAEPGNQAAAQTLDGSVREGFRYQYRAVRRVVAQVGGRTLEVRSAASPPAEFVWRDTYPPPAPEGLTALGFLTPASSPNGMPTYGVDLVWQPVNDRRVTGYEVRRTALSAAGEDVGEPERLTAEPVVAPAFHDATALRFVRYRYKVTAVDAKGNTSAAATAVVEGMAR